jgi:hypothetical protein
VPLQIAASFACAVAPALSVLIYHHSLQDDRCFRLSQTEQYHIFSHQLGIHLPLVTWLDESTTWCILVQVKNIAL